MRPAVWTAPLSFWAIVLSVATLFELVLPTPQEEITHMNVNGNNYDMTITSAEAPDCTSSRTQNFWLTDTQPIGDSNGSCYIAQSTATLTIEMGGTI